MQSLRSVLRESIEQLGLVEHLTVAFILVSLACAAVCGLIIYAVYRLFYRGAVYSENFALLIVMTTVITAFIVITIGSNLVLSLGMVGALSIVRFRSAVKDPLDVGFLFFGIAVGIASGAGLYPFALIATAAISLVYILFTLISKGRRTFVMVVKYRDEAAESVDKLMSESKGKLRGKAKYGDENELTFDIKFNKKSSQILDKFNAVEGVTSAVMVEYVGD